MTTTTRDGDLWLRTTCANVHAGCPAIPDESVDLMVTSPPYKKRDKFTPDLMAALGKLASRVLKPDGRLWVNFGQLSEDFQRSVDVPTQIRAGSPALELGQTVIWAKSISIGETSHGHLQPISSPRIMSYCWEFIYQLHKGDPRDLDRLAIGVPFMDKSNLTRGNRGKNGDLRCAGDLWFIPYETTGPSKKKKHQYEFPADVARRCIRVSNLEPQSVVLDPFGGSGQVAAVAKEEGHHAWTVEFNPEHLVMATARWKHAK